jgi:hypothetical protein
VKLCRYVQLGREDETQSLQVVENNEPRDVQVVENNEPRDVQIVEKRRDSERTSCGETTRLSAYKLWRKATFRAKHIVVLPTASQISDRTDHLC